MKTNYIPGVPLSKDNTIIIKKYSNRRLYDTSISEYITMETVAEMIKKDVELKIIDAKSGDDLTRITLTQILLDQEIKGYNLMPIELIKQIIKLCNHPFNKTFSDYLLQSLQMFNHNMSDMNSLMTGFMGKNQTDWAKQIEKFNKQNMEFFNQFMNSTKKK